jgi:hypothetical protein
MNVPSYYLLNIVTGDRRWFLVNPNKMVVANEWQYNDTAQHTKL